MSDIKEKVYKYIEDNKMNIAKMLSGLIRIDSSNNGAFEPGDEGPIQEYVFGEMEKLGLEPIKLAFDEEKKRPNVLGKYQGTGGGKSILFNAHSDVVKVTDIDEWTHDPFGGEIDGGCVHGRGAADDKEGIAAMYWAVKALKDNGVKTKGDVYLLSSVGEETCEGNEVGAGPAVEAMPVKPDFAVVCESTHLAFETVSSNLTFFEVIVKGKSGHMCVRNQALYPQPYGIAAGNEICVDAFEKALPIIEMFYRKERDWSRNLRHDVWGSGGRGAASDSAGVGCNIINLAKIQGGDYELSVMGSVKLTYGILCTPKMSIEEVKKEILDSIAAVVSTDSWLRENPPIVNMPIITEFPAYDTPLDNPGIQACTKALKEACGRDAIYSGQRATVDASWIAMRGIPCVTVGAGGADTGPHGINEFVNIDELAESVKLYAGTIMEFCGIE